MPQRILIVANQTLGGHELAETVRERVDAGATDLWIVVPATAPRDHAPVSIAGAGALFPLVGPADTDAYELAERRLDEARERFTGLGVEVGGEVGDPDPFAAVSEVLKQREFDEIVVSTLPTVASHWLRTDLPSRLHRKFKVPVTTVTHRQRA
jgi:hypothetical protein